MSGYRDPIAGQRSDPCRILLFVGGLDERGFEQVVETHLDPLFDVVFALFQLHDNLFHAASSALRKMASKPTMPL